MKFIVMANLIWGTSRVINLLYVSINDVMGTGSTQLTNISSQQVGKSIDANTKFGTND